MNFFNLGLFVEVDELLEDYGLTKEKKNEIRNKAIKWYKEREKTCYDSVSRNWKDLMCDKPFEIDDIELILVDCHNNGEYDLAIYLDYNTIVKGIDAGYIPMHQWGKGYYEVDPPEEWFDWEIKPENITKVELYDNEDILKLNEEDKKEIAKYLFCLGTEEDAFAKEYELHLRDEYDRRYRKDDEY